MAYGIYMYSKKIKNQISGLKLKSIVGIFKMFTFGPNLNKITLIYIFVMTWQKISRRNWSQIALKEYIIMIIFTIHHRLIIC